MRKKMADIITIQEENIIKMLLTLGKNSVI